MNIEQLLVEKSYNTMVECRECDDFKCKSYKSFKEHCNWCHKKGRKPIECCGHEFSREYNYQRHLKSRRHNETAMNKPFGLKYRHNIYFKQKRYTCSYCLYTTCHKGDYTRHCGTKAHKLKAPQSTHSEIQRGKCTKKYLCECCNFETTNRSHYRRHVDSKVHKRHNKYVTYSCNVCKFFTSKLTNYKRHCITRKHLMLSQ